MSDFACKSLPFAKSGGGLLSISRDRGRDLSSGSRHTYMQLPLNGNCCEHAGHEPLTIEKIGEATNTKIGFFTSLKCSRRQKDIVAASGPDLDSSRTSLGEGSGASKFEDDESILEYDEGITLDEDLYGVSIASFLRDFRKLITGHGNFWLRLSRLLVTTGLIISLVCLQFYLVIMMKLKVTPAGVAEMREMYDKYEAHMYVNDTFHMERFLTLDEGVREEICSIPLSHPLFFSAMLLIWTCTVVADIRRLTYLAVLFAFRIRTVSRMYDIFEHDDDEKHGRPTRTEDKTVVLVGLTAPTKAMLMLFVFLPRLVLDFTLLWLGCRWLTSTPSLQDVFLNAVALEFILYLKDLLYYAVVPTRNKIESQELRIPLDTVEVAHYQPYLGAFAWLLVSVSWVPLYIFVLQHVLPNYKWDVREVCNKYVG